MRKFKANHWWFADRCYYYTAQLNCKYLDIVIFRNGCTFYSGICLDKDRTAILSMRSLSDKDHIRYMDGLLLSLPLCFSCKQKTSILRLLQSISTRSA